MSRMGAERVEPKGVGQCERLSVRKVIRVRAGMESMRISCVAAVSARLLSIQFRSVSECSLGNRLIAAHRSIWSSWEEDLEWEASALRG